MSVCVESGPDKAPPLHTGSVALLGLTANTRKFYQDNDDVSVGVDQLMESFDGRCVGGKSSLRRELDASALEEHLIQGHGAVQLGAHKFWIVADDKPEQLVANLRFVHLWKRPGNLWVIARVIVYGHVADD